MNNKKILWNDSIFFFDIDDTLINTSEASSQASEGIERVLVDRFTEPVAKHVRIHFDNVFQTMMVGHTAKDIKIWEGRSGKDFYDRIIRTIEDAQQQTKKEQGRAKRWSREIFLWFAAKELGLELAPEIVYEAIDAYWMKLSEITVVLPGVLELFHIIHDRMRPVYLATGSDARLRMQPDGQFIYDPVYSEGLKRERVELLRQKGLAFRGVSIGDPEDKPHKDFFEKGIRMAEKDLGKTIDLAHAIMVGDSYAMDLQTPKEQLGFGLVVQFQAGKESVELVDDHHIVTGNLMHIVDYLG